MRTTARIPLLGALVLFAGGSLCLGSLALGYMAASAVTLSVAFSMVALSLGLATAAALYQVLVQRPLAAFAQGLRDFAEKPDGESIQLGSGDSELGRVIDSVAIVCSMVVDYRTQLERMTAIRTQELERINGQLSITVNKVRKELRMARVIQSALLPRRMPDLEEVSATAVCEPADDVGGDFFDLYAFREKRLGFLVADVSGHGVSAALVSIVAKMAFLNNVHHEADPGEVLSRVNAELCRSIGELDQYLTAFFGFLDVPTGTLRFASAGHPEVIVQFASGARLLLPPGGTILGTFPYATYPTESVQLPEKCRIVAYTDGIIEATDADGHEFGRQGIEDAVQMSGDSPQQSFIESVFAHPAHAGPARDDRTMLVLDFDPRVASGSNPPSIEATNADLHEQLTLLRNAATLIRSGNLEEAEVALAEVRAGVYEGRRADLRAHIFFRRREFDRARAFWQEALRLDPDNGKVAENLKIVEARYARNGAQIG